MISILCGLRHTFGSCLLFLLNNLLYIVFIDKHLLFFMEQSLGFIQLLLWFPDLDIIASLLTQTINFFLSLRKELAHVPSCVSELILVFGHPVPLQVLLIFD